MEQSQAPCYCTPEDEMDICRHADSSAGCPRHDKRVFEEYLFELRNGDI